jgi:uncharacterized protein YndB with AHSA1/START domain
MQNEGTLEQLDDQWRVRFTRALPHPPEKVWRALTEPEHLAAWFPTEIIGERADGAALRFEFRNGEGPGFDGTMITYDPPRVLEFFWGKDLLRIELEPTEQGTALTLTDTLEELGKAARDAAGWHVCLARLDLDLGGNRGKPDERWQELHDMYVERFGLAAASIGPPAGPPQGHAEAGSS